MKIHKIIIFFESFDVISINHKTNRKCTGVYEYTAASTGRTHIERFKKKPSKSRNMMSQEIKNAEN